MKPTHTITAEEAAKYLGVHPQSLRSQAAADPAALCFPVCRIGKHIIIPRQPFFQFMGIKEKEEDPNHDDPVSDE